MSLLQSRAFRVLSPFSPQSRISFIRTTRGYSSHSEDNQEAEFAKAREWYSTFKRSTIPEKIATTKYSKASGSGGQKTNKTDSKATTVWPLHALLPLIPKVLHQGIRESRFYAVNSDAITIQCDAQRGRTQNKDETHEKLFGEIEKIYKDTVQGITTTETKKKIESLRKAENELRLMFKKKQGDKKRARSGGGGHHGD